ncbi:MAG: IS66 family transposase [Planctomycetota bacterium]|nr:IS66 family transposase [Planctomycetota bacterium]
MDADPTSTDASACPGCAERDRRIARLEAQVKQLQQHVEALSRSAKRQAAPFSRGLPRSDPKRPGRKSGDDYGTKAFRAVPPVIDEVHEAPLPRQCPKCGGRVIASHVDQQYQVEIPRRPIHRQFNVAVGRCACCDGRVQGRHRLQTSDALGCCASQVGPEAQSAVVMLNKELGLSQGKISRLFQMFFGIKLTRGGSCQIMLRAAERCQGNYQAIVQRVQQNAWIVPDETGWRVGGWLAWLHVAATQDAVAYLIARQRGVEASALLIGADYAGTLIHDGWASYDRFWRAVHQTCLAHLLRRCHELLQHATRGAVIFPRKVKALLRESLETRDQRDARKITAKAAAIQADDLQGRMTTLVRLVKTNAANERLAAHLQRHGSQLFTFLRQKGIDATNWRAEQALRPAVVNRKVWGGNRTEAGAVAQSVLMTVLITAAKLQRDGLQFVSRVLCSPHGHRPMLLSGTG